MGSLSEDGDKDGLGDAQEYAIGTNPTSADSDGDYLPDKWEYDNNLDPLSAAGNDGWSGDPDEDGLNNWREKPLGTLPNNADTDADDDISSIPSSLLEGSSPIYFKKIIKGFYVRKEVQKGTW